VGFVILTKHPRAGEEYVSRRALDSRLSRRFHLGEEQLQVGAHVIGDAGVARRVGVQAVWVVELSAAADTFQEERYEGHLVFGGEAGIDVAEAAGVFLSVLPGRNPHPHEEDAHPRSL
jgi:hypothetical protein